MRELAILADDLTGALDTAAAFASQGQPVKASWRDLVGDRSVLDTETRYAEPSHTRARIASLLPELAKARIAFKKLDSLLRGNSLAELSDCCRDGRFGAVYIAPAFPAQGRITVDGRQVAIQDGRRSDVCSIVDALREQRLAPDLARSASEIAATGVVVCDAATDADLQAIVATGRRGRPPVLWCGSAGLAQAIAGTNRHAVEARAELAVIGSRHEVTRRDFALLNGACALEAMTLVAPEQADDAASHLAKALRGGRQAALMFDLPPIAEAQVEGVYRHIFSRLRDAAPPPTGVIVVGGDTAFRLLDVLGTISLDVMGSYAPGIAVSHICGGAWSGTRLISKSGAFTDSGLFATFIGKETSFA